jgi:(p)ppGpp synthase/HD superfamily hydrolase
MMNEKQKPNWEPTDLIQEAFDVATIKHKNQVRKGTSIPYISHLMAVSALVTEQGGTEAQAAAGLLHDLIEDTDLKDEFFISALVGSDVTAIIVSCSDTSEDPKPPWRDRKEKYLVHLREMISQPKLDPAILVALADKVHNAETTADTVLHKSKTAKEI